MTIFGYARVSTQAQELDIQLGQLKAAGCEVLFFEKESGMKPDRRMFKRLLKNLHSGDVVIVPAFDRLTRIGPLKLMTVLHQITSRGATCQSLAEPCANATGELEELLAAFHGYIARRTRDDIIRRTQAGRDQARLAGVRFGRKPKLSAAQKVEALRRRAAGEVQKTIASRFDVSCSTISRLGKSAGARS